MLVYVQHTESQISKEPMPENKNWLIYKQAELWPSIYQGKIMCGHTKEFLLAILNIYFITYVANYIIGLHWLLTLLTVE